MSERGDAESWDPYGPPPHTEDPWSRVQTRHGFAADELVSTLQKEIRRGGPSARLSPGCLHSSAGR